MHELSIANMLLKMVRENTPQGAAVRRVSVEAGPMQAIEPMAMELAWRAATVGTAMQGVTLDMELKPFELTCPDCGRRWLCDDMFDRCPCGQDQPRVTGGDHLVLLAIDIDDRVSATPTTPSLQGESTCKSP